MNHPSTRLTDRKKPGAAFTLGTIALLAAASLSNAAVLVSITDNDGTPSVGAGDAGLPFTVNVTMTSTLEQTTGLTYFLQDTSFFGIPHFQIIGRDITGSPFSDLTTDNGTVLAAASAVLDPSNNHDLGAGLPNVNSPLGIGTFHVATLTILVLPGTPNGTYMIDLTPNSIAAGPPPNFEEIQVQRFKYTVTTPSIPEPASASLLLVSGALAAARTRFRR
jgi:hypothetical protein